MKKLFLDSIYATIFILLSVYGLSKIEINSDVVNPVSKAFSDFNLTDIVFSQLRERAGEDTNIVMVNLGPYTRTRADLARMIEIIANYKPKVVGIDAFYRKPKADTTLDSALVRAFSKLDHLVLVSQIHKGENNTTDVNDSMVTSHSMFMRYAEPGIANMITKGRETFKTSRECFVEEKVKIPAERKRFDTTITMEMMDSAGVTQLIKKDTSLLKVTKYKDTIFWAFPVKMAMIYDSAKTKAFLSRNREFGYEIINWQGNIDTRTEDISENAKNTFRTLDWYQLEDTSFVPEVIKDKIVIIGYLGDEIGDNKWEDKFFTPLNANYIGKANPDMYGVVVHANVVSMILKGDFIDEMPFWATLLLSILLIFLNVWFFSYLYHKMELWYDGISLLITLAEILVLIFIVLIVFNEYSYKIDITLASVALFLTGNLIEMYYGIAKPTVLRLVNKIPVLNKK